MNYSDPADEETQHTYVRELPTLCVSERDVEK